MHRNANRLPENRRDGLKLFVGLSVCLDWWCAFVNDVLKGFVLFICHDMHLISY